MYNKYTVFEYNAVKSKANLLKHGIDFIEAQALWNDPGRLEIPAKTVDEKRFLLIGRIGSKHWTAVTTHREARIRVISVRRSRPEEVKLYESERL